MCSFLTLLFNLSFVFCHSFSKHIFPQGHNKIYCKNFLVSQTKNLSIYLLTENSGIFGSMINSHSLQFNSNKPCSTHVNLVSITYWKLHLLPIQSPCLSNYHKHSVKGFCQLYVRNSSNQEPEAEHLSKHLPYCRLALNEATDIPNRKGVVSPIVMTFSDQKQAFFNGDIVSCWLKELFSLFSRYSPMKPPANNKIHVPLSHYQMEYTVSRADFISTR